MLKEGIKADDTEEDAWEDEIAGETSPLEIDGNPKPLHQMCGATFSCHTSSVVAPNRLFSS